MKKLVSVILMLVFLVSVASVASAAAIDFEFWAQCTNASSTALDKDVSKVSYKNTGNNDKSVYVKHWVWDGSEEYTNYFRAYNEDTPDTYHGAKWATVGLYVPIQSNSLIGGAYYGVAGRGNTNHYDYDGNYRVSLHGYVDANMSGN